MKNRKSKEEFLPIRDAVRDLLSSYHLESKFDEAQVVASWEQLVGAPIASRTERVFIKNKVLYVQFKTAAMKHDFLLHKQKVLDLFQRQFGNNVIRDIVIL